jgi:hypothetical protein
MTMNDKTSGPRDFPLRDYVKDFEMMVIVYNIKDDCVFKEIPINYGNFEHRKFLGRISYWACSNGHSVETMSLKDWNATK